jgi:putative lipoprotein
MAQLTRGLAWWSRESSNGLSEEDRGRYEFAEHEAKAKRAGLWAQSNPVPPWEWRSGKQEMQPHWQTFAYTCAGGYSFVARIEGEKIWLFLPAQTLSLPHVPSGSGAKYGDGAVTFWTKGEQALLEIDQETHRDCNNNRSRAIWEDAKLRGVDFRATGNEPGWHLELQADRQSIFVGEYGERLIEFATPKPIVKQQERGTTYKAQAEGLLIKTIIEGRPCTDSMSGQQFEATVTVEVDGKLYRGCGKALH